MLRVLLVLIIHPNFFMKLAFFNWFSIDISTLQSDNYGQLSKDSDKSLMKSILVGDVRKSAQIFKTIDTNERFILSGRNRVEAVRRPRCAGI